MWDMLLSKCKEASQTFCLLSGRQTRDNTFSLTLGGVFHHAPGSQELCQGGKPLHFHKMCSQFCHTCIFAKALHLSALPALIACRQTRLDQGDAVWNVEATKVSAEQIMAQNETILEVCCPCPVKQPVTFVLRIVMKEIAFAKLKLHIKYQGSLHLLNKTPSGVATPVEVTLLSL